jgi:YesN/AraC family two-component response regulator
MILHIKNMVCDRCIMAVRQLLDQQGIAYKNVQLGQVELSTTPPAEKLSSLREELNKLGFELLDDKRSQVVEKIKNIIISLIQGYNSEEMNLKLSAHLQEKLNLDYHYLSTLFSSVEGITIERFAILQRIEKAKELLVYNEKNLSEIAYDLGYSSVQHLSQQFKKITGLTPSGFKELKENKRNTLDSL